MAWYRGLNGSLPSRAESSLVSKPQPAEPHHVQPDIEASTPACRVTIRPYGHTDWHFGSAPTWYRSLNTSLVSKPQRQPAEPRHPMSEFRLRSQLPILPKQPSPDSERVPVACFQPYRRDDIVDGASAARLAKKTRRPRFPSEASRPRFLGEATQPTSLSKSPPPTSPFHRGRDREKHKCCLCFQGHPRKVSHRDTYLGKLVRSPRVFRSSTAVRWPAGSCPARARFLPRAQLSTIQSGFRSCFVGVWEFSEWGVAAPTAVSAATPYCGQLPTARSGLLSKRTQRRPAGPPSAPRRS